MRMPFGKYRGRSIDVLPDDYLSWLLERHDLRDPLLSAVENEINARKYAARPKSAPARVPCPAPDLADEIIGAGLRNLSRRHHPDAAGGSHEKMVALNAAAEWLRRVVHESGAAP